MVPKQVPKEFAGKPLVSTLKQPVVMLQMQVDQFQWAKALFCQERLVKDPHFQDGESITMKPAPQLQTVQKVLFLEQPVVTTDLAAWLAGHSLCGIG